jgi:rfaE bifunctional protein kinase chain/domain
VEHLSYSPETPAAHRNASARPTVLVVGDVIGDLYLAGTVQHAAPRLAAQHAAPIFCGASRYECLGGAANAAANLRALGNEVRLLGVVGADATGRRTRELLREQGIADTFCLEDMTRPTTQRTYLVAGDSHVLRLDHESRAPLAAPLIARLLECVDALVAEADAVVCVDSGKGVCVPGLIDPLLAAARSAGCPVYVDCASQDAARYRGVTAIVAHLSPAGQGADPEGAARALLDQSRAQALLLARGQDGVTLFHPPEAPLHLPVRAGDAWDGAGSCRTVVAALCAGVLNGLSMAGAARLAASAGGVKAGQVETTVVSWADLPERPIHGR